MTRHGFPAVNAPSGMSLKLFGRPDITTRLRWLSRARRATFPARQRPQQPCAGHSVPVCVFAFGSRTANVLLSLLGCIFHLKPAITKVAIQIVCDDANAIGLSQNDTLGYIHG